MRQLRRKALCIIAAAVMLLSGCGNADSTSATELNIHIGTSPTTIDPQMVSDTNSSAVVKFFTSTLYEYNSNRELVPGLAESCEVSEDGLTVTYRLRDGLQWSNGSPLTADDFVYAFQRLADPSTKSGAIYLITDCCLIKNASKVCTGELSVSELGVSAPDKLTFIIKLEQPCPYINSLISLCCFSPCSREFVNSCGDSYGTDPDTVISCGPYVLDRYEPLASQIHFTENGNYYMNGNVELSGVNLQVVGDTQQALMCYETGLLDIFRISGEFADLAEGDPHMVSYPTAQIYRIDIDHSFNESLKNLNIRRAIAKSIDRDSIAKNVLKSGFKALERVVPDYFYTETNGQDFAADPKLYSDQMGYDPDKAAEYWANGLKELGVSGLPIEFVYAASQSRIAEPVAKQLEDHLPGLELKLTPLPDKEWLKRMSSGEKYDLILESWVPDFTDPTALFTTCLGSGENNLYSGREFRELYDKSQSMSGAERDEMLHRAEEMLMNDIALIPLFGGEQRYMICDGVSGLQVTPTGVEIVVNDLKKEMR